MGFFFPDTYHIYGLPERKMQFQLSTTEDIGPYRLYNQDLFPHATNSSVNLYGSVPYLTGHSRHSDASIAWLNAADTWVTILNATNGTYAGFVSESATLEFFIFGASGPLRVQQSLADVTGYAPLPPAYSLGFHFSKWDPDSTAEKVIERNSRFTEHGFPVDVLWLDIDHTY